MAINMKDTVSLMQAMERFKAPATTLVDTFFPNIPTPAVTSKIMVEYRKGGRRLAPFVVDGEVHGVNVSREGSNINIYEPPMVAPRRTVNPADIEQRGFGENIYTSKTAAQRAAEIQATDLKELQAMILNRKNQMAAEILTTGSYTIKGYADDGVTEKQATISFDWNQSITPDTDWDQAGATIYSDIKNASEQIQENAGIVPTVMICGKNIADYLLNNAEIINESDGVFLRAAAAGWGTEGVNGGRVTLYATDQEINGDLLADDVSSLNLYLSEGSSFSGAINPDGEAGDVYVEIDDDSVWTLSGDSYITSLTCDADAVDLNGYKLYINGVEYTEGTASEGSAIEVTVSSSASHSGMPAGEPPAKP